MKKKFLTLITAVLTLLCAAAFAACDGAEVKQTEIDGKPSFVFTATSEVLVFNGDKSVTDYIAALKEANELSYEGYDSALGYYVTEINGIKEEVTATLNSSSGSAWAVYIDFLTLDGVVYGNENQTATYGGKTYYSSMNGISYTPCVEGHTYIFVYDSFSYRW